MIHFIYGLSSKNIYIDNLLEKNEQEKIYFDNSNLDDFFSELNAFSLFSTPTLLVIKNGENIKNIEKFLEKILLSNSNKDVLIDVYSEKEIKKVKDFSDKINIYEIINKNENKKNLLEYISKKLNCSSNDSYKLLEIFGEDYYVIKNETDKILAFLNGEKFSFNNIKEILAKNTNFIIFTVIDDILSKKNIEFPLKEHISLLYQLVTSLEMIYKLKISKISANNYNEFKNIIIDNELFKMYNPYNLYTKLNFINNFTKKEIIDLLNLAFDIEFKIKNGTIALEEGVELFILKIINQK